MIYIDTHIHTSRYSTCSSLDPYDLIKRAYQLKLNGIVITEHHFLWTRENISQLKMEAGFPDFLVLRGQEIRGYKKDGEIEGDFLVFGYEKDIAEGISSEAIIQLVHNQGGIVIAAHPFRKQLGIGEAVYTLDLDGIEVLNANHSPEDTKKASEASVKRNLPATGGSDAHSIERIGLNLTAFQNKIYTEEDLVREIKMKRCKPVRYDEVFSLHNRFDGF